MATTVNRGKFNSGRGERGFVLSVNLESVNLDSVNIESVNIKSVNFSLSSLPPSLPPFRYLTDALTDEQVGGIVVGTILLALLAAGATWFGRKYRHLLCQVRFFHRIDDGERSREDDMFVADSVV